MDYELLDWDTKFFGVKVAKIISSNIKRPELKYILSDLQRNGVTLAYWTANKKIESCDANNFGAHLVDIKTTFEIEFGELNLRDFISTNIVEKYNPSMSIEELETLAVQSGEYSRFFVDKKIPNEKFKDLYKIWIRRSIKKEIADEVLVIREDKRVVGMITLVDTNGKGDIGLLGVDSSCRGRKYGEMLVRSAQIWFVRNGYKLGQVITQGKNVPACNLYKKCGYVEGRVKYFYHFWL